MKKFITLTLIFFTITFYAQWIEQSPGVGVTLNDVYCISEDVVVIVGEAGTIIKTNNGGSNWEQKSSGTFSDLTKIEFASQNIGYAVGNIGDIGNNGQLLKTIDGGESWSSIVTGEFYISDLSSVSESIFYYTSGGLLKKTTDGGLSFSTLTSTQYIEKIQFINELIGFASSFDTLLKTIDGGNSWQIIGNVTYGFNHAPFFFYNEMIGYILNGSQLFRTTDGGATSIFLTTINFTMLELFAAEDDVIWGISGEVLLDGQPNYTMRGEISNLGEFERIDGNMVFRAIYFVTPNVGYALGMGNQVFKNVTGTMALHQAGQRENFVKIYPNPASDYIMISFAENPQPFSIKICDSAGKHVYSKSYSILEKTILIDTKSLSKGTYFLTISSEATTQTQKIIIN